MMTGIYFVEDTLFWESNSMVLKPIHRIITHSRKVGEQ